MNNFPFSITNEGVTLILDGETKTVPRGEPNFIPLCKALVEGDEEGIKNNLTSVKSLAQWLEGRDGFTVGTSDGGYSSRPVVWYKSTKLPDSVVKRISDMAAAGDSPVPLFKFWERLAKNPSNRSVEQLWGFLDNIGIPLTEDGCFLAYKAVRPDYTDYHSGTFSNRPGMINTMPRNQISDDPELACHNGLHVGALGYAESFGDSNRVLVIVEVDPEHVVCVPRDSSCMKMRVCQYEVIGVYSGPLSSTIHENDTDDETRSDVIEHDEDDDFCECNECYGPYHDEGDEVEEGLMAWGQQESEPEESPVTVTKVAKRWAKYQAMAGTDLFNLTIEKLRQYAGKGLKIVGASKIPGGKTNLISRILEVRGK